MYQLSRVSLFAAVLLVVASFIAPVVHGNDAYPQFSWDVGGGSGFSDGETFFEIQAGLNSQFTSFLTWRNAAFYRTGSDEDDFFGLDTSARLGSSFALSGDSSVSYYGGVGYRFATNGDHAPFAEAALDFNASGLQIGVNGKYIFQELIDSDRSDEMVLTVNFSGGGTL